METPQEPPSEDPHEHHPTDTNLVSEISPPSSGNVHKDSGSFPEFFGAQFPRAPSDGQGFNLDGTDYRYTAKTGHWVRVKAPDFLRLTNAPSQEDIHQNAVEKGFWTASQDTPTKLMLIVTEVAEAMECYRQNDMQLRFGGAAEDKPEGFPSELADVVIRCMDLAAFLGFDLEHIITLKHTYNLRRPQMHGGKVV